MVESCSVDYKGELNGQKDLGILKAVMKRWRARRDPTFTCSNKEGLTEKLILKLILGFGKKRICQPDMR